MKPIAIVLLAAALTACATSQTTGERAQATDGPTIYGQISVSVDHVSTD